MGSGPATEFEDDNEPDAESVDDDDYGYDYHRDTEPYVTISGLPAASPSSSPANCDVMIDPLKPTGSPVSSNGTSNDVHKLPPAPTSPRPASAQLPTASSISVHVASPKIPQDDKNLADHFERYNTMRPPPPGMLERIQFDSNLRLSFLPFDADIDKTPSNPAIPAEFKWSPRHGSTTYGPVTPERRRAIQRLREQVDGLIKAEMLPHYIVRNIRSTPINVRVIRMNKKERSKKRRRNAMSDQTGEQRGRLPYASGPWKYRKDARGRAITPAMGSEEDKKMKRGRTRVVTSPGISIDLEHLSVDSEKRARSESPDSSEEMPSPSKKTRQVMERNSGIRLKLRKPGKKVTAEQAEQQGLYRTEETVAEKQARLEMLQAAGLQETVDVPVSDLLSTTSAKDDPCFLSKPNIEHELGEPGPSRKREPKTEDSSLYFPESLRLSESSDSPSSSEEGDDYIPSPEAEPIVRWDIENFRRLYYKVGSSELEGEEHEREEHGWIDG